jgi:hypothetical protein
MTGGLPFAELKQNNFRRGGNRKRNSKVRRFIWGLVVMQPPRILCLASAALTNAAFASPADFWRRAPVAVAVNGAYF